MASGQHDQNLARPVLISEETRYDLEAFAATVGKAFPVNATMLRRIVAFWDEGSDVRLLNERDAA